MCACDVRHCCGCPFSYIYIQSQSIYGYTHTQWLIEAGIKLLNFWSDYFVVYRKKSNFVSWFWRANIYFDPYPPLNLFLSFMCLMAQLFVCTLSYVSPVQHINSSFWFLIYDLKATVWDFLCCFITRYDSKTSLSSPTPELCIIFPSYGLWRQNSFAV